VSRFTGIPAIPFTGLDPAQARVLSAIKENVELLTGGRGEEGQTSRALTRGQINLRPIPQPAFGNITAQADGFNIQGADVVSLSDYRRALDDIQRLARDVEVLRQYVDTLTKQLRG
jgi:hypothetical protein